PARTTQKGCSGMHEVPASAVLLEVVELDRQICIYINTFDMECNRIIRPLENLQRPILVVHTRELIIVLSDYTSLLVDIFSLQYDALGALRQFIDGERDSARTRTVLRSNREATVVSLTRAVTAGCHVLDALSALERHIIKDLSYLPGLHFIIRLLGLDWNTRGLALKSVPKTIKVIFANVQATIALIVRLKGCASDPQLSVSGSLLADIADMPEDRRMQVASLVKQIAWELYSLRRRARETADYIRDLATRESTALVSRIRHISRYSIVFSDRSPGLYYHRVSCGRSAESSKCLGQNTLFALTPVRRRGHEICGEPTKGRRSCFDALSLPVTCKFYVTCHICMPHPLPVELANALPCRTSATAAPSSHGNTHLAANASAMELTTISSHRHSSVPSLAPSSVPADSCAGHVVVNIDGDSPIATIHDVCMEVRKGLDLVLQVFDQVGPAETESIIRLGEQVKQPLLHLINVERVMEEIFTSITNHQVFRGESSSTFGAEILEELLKDDTSLDIPNIQRLLDESGSELKDARESFLMLPTTFSTPDGFVDIIAHKFQENLPMVSRILKTFSVITTGLGRLNELFGGAATTALIGVTMAAESAQIFIDRGILDPTSTYNVHKASVNAIRVLSSAAVSHIDLYEGLKNVLHLAIDARGANILNTEARETILRIFSQFNPRVPSTPPVRLWDECTRSLLAIERRRELLRPHD
ncbi:hypothetical protein EV714DRAFT_202146, partial [Schizophyllum commune]